MTKEQIERWQSDAIVAFHTKAYEGSFDIYWQLTGILRKNVSVPYPEYWEEVKKIKLAAWKAEEIKSGGDNE